MNQPAQALHETHRAESVADSAMLYMEDICHDFGTLRAVDHVTLDVQRGEVVCLLGPSGCGKSTLLRVAASLEELQHGRVMIGGEDMRSPSGRNVPPERRNVGLMFQDSALFPHLSVVENVMFGLDHLPTRQRRAGCKSQTFGSGTGFLARAPERGLGCRLRAGSMTVR